MSTINLILEPDADGSLHLPLPEELRHGKVTIVATLEPVPIELNSEQEKQRQQRLLEVMRRIRERNPFKEITDPVAWQREMREYRPLPGRN